MISDTHNYENDVKDSQIQDLCPGYFDSLVLSKALYSGWCFKYINMLLPVIMRFGEYWGSRFKDSCSEGALVVAYFPLGGRTSSLIWQPCLHPIVTTDANIIH